MENSTFHNAVENCRYCFMCRHAGTTFRATKRDAHTARGRALQLSSVLEGHRSWTAKTAETAYQDPIDGLCRELCAFHWPEDDVIRESRKMICAEGLEAASIKSAMDEAASKHDSDWSPEKNRIEGASDVLYLTGWAARRYAKDIIDTQLRVLDKGFGPVAMLAEEVATAAAAAFDLGYVDRAKKLSGELVKAILARKPKRVVTGCSHTLRVLHGETGGPNLSADIPVQHFVEAVEELASNGKLTFKQQKTDAVAIHDAEHLARTRRIVETPRKIASLALVSTLSEFEHHGAEAESAGAGAILFRTHPDLTAAIAQTRIKQAGEAGIQYIITSCPHCYIALDSQSADGAKVEDISQLVCRAAGL